MNKAIYKTMFLTLIITMIVNAVMPPESYRRLQESSDEYIYITVISIKLDSSEVNTYHRIGVKIDAVVDSIVWSKNNLNKRDTIKIEYIHYLQKYLDTLITENDTMIIFVCKLGPGTVRILKLNDYVPAFLNRSDNDVFIPSAIIYSFSSYLGNNSSVEEIKKVINPSSIIIKRKNNLLVDLSSYKPTNILVEIINAQGRIINSYSFFGGDMYNISLDNLAGQMLFIRISIPKQVILQKISEP